MKKDDASHPSIYQLTSSWFIRPTNEYEIDGNPIFSRPYQFSTHPTWWPKIDRCMYRCPSPVEDFPTKKDYQPKVEIASPKLIPADQTMLYSDIRVLNKQYILMHDLVTPFQPYHMVLGNCKVGKERRTNPISQYIHSSSYTSRVLSGLNATRFGLATVGHIIELLFLNLRTIHEPHKYWKWHFLIIEFYPDSIT